MKTPITFLTLLVLVFFKNTLAQHFAPLQVSNAWIYKEDGHRIERCTVVDDSVLVDSVLYYEIIMKTGILDLKA